MTEKYVMAGNGQFHPGYELLDGGVSGVALVTLGAATPEMPELNYSYCPRSRDEIAQSAAIISVAACRLPEDKVSSEEAGMGLQMQYSDKAARFIAGLNQCNSPFIEQPIGVAG